MSHSNTANATADANKVHRPDPMDDDLETAMQISHRLACAGGHIPGKTDNRLPEFVQKYCEEVVSTILPHVLVAEIGILS